MNVLFFLAAFLFLLISSRFFTIQLGQVLVKFTRNTMLAIHLMALLFFPGVLIHELGHFLMASLLFVRTGEIEFLPKVQADGIKLGSVAIAHTDPFRRFLIGVAPVLSGIGILLLAVHYLSPLWPLSWQTIVFGYILFEIGNTMFSSKKDLEGAVGLLAFVGFLVLCLFLLGARIPVAITNELALLASQNIFLQMSMWLLGSGLINVVLWGILRKVGR